MKVFSTYKLLAIVLLGVLLAACGDKVTDKNTKAHNAGKTDTAQTASSSKTNKSPNSLDYQVLPTVQKEKTVAIVQNSVARVYKKASKLMFSLTGKPDVVISEQIDSNNYWLASAGDYVYVFWWEKFANLVKGDEHQKISGKVIYVRSSQDGGKTFGERQTITHAGGVLPKLRIVADKKGNISLVYLDERFGGFNIYTNASHDGGKTWNADDLRLDHASDEAMKQKNHTAVSPNIARSANEIVATWQQMDKQGDKQVLRMYSRVSHDFGKTWEKQTAVFDTDKTLSFSMGMFGDKDQVYLIAGMQEHGILVFTKKDKAGWQRVEGVLPGSDKGKGGSYYRMVSDAGTFYITYVFVEKVEGQKVYWHTDIARLDKAKNAWLPGSFRFDSRGMGVSSKGGYQDIVMLDDGTLVVVWEDFRRILPMIALNYSTDKGETWLNIPLIVSRQDIVNNSFKPFIRKTGNTFTVFYQNNMYPEQVKPEVKTLAVTLPSPQSKDFDKKALALKSLPSDAELKKRLTERFNLLKDSRLNHKWKQAWTLQDPLYRNLYKKKMWLKTRDRVIYTKLDLESVKLDNPYGYALGDMVYSLDPDYIDAEPNDPRFSNQKKKFVLKWGWFVDDWYLITETGTEPYLP